MSHGYDSSAWDLANLYLGSLGADPLGKEGVIDHTVLAGAVVVALAGARQ
jgi:hypothetical protein